MSNKTTKWILELVDEVTSPLGKVNSEAKLATSLGEDLGDTYENLGGEIKETGEVAEVAGQDFNGMLDDMLGADFSSISGGLDGIKNSIGGMTKAAMAFIATPLGAAIATLGAIGLVANEFVEYNEAVRDANMLTQQTTQTTGDALDETRIRAASFAETFDADIKDTLQVAKNNVEAFGVTWDEAFDIMENGAIRGGKANDDYLRSLREYPKLFAQNGFALKDFQRIINEGIERGIYDDKLPDAIKEFSLSVNEQTQTSRDALENAFGKKFTDELFNNIKNGSKTPKEALIAIANETVKVGVNAQEAQQLTADLFRGAGEDAGGFLEVIEAVNNALVNEERALTPLELQLQKTADANLRLKEAQDQALQSDAYAKLSADASMYWTEIKIAWYEGVDWVINLHDRFSEGLVTKTMQIYNTIGMAPAIFKKSFGDIKEEVFDLLGTFGDLSGILSDVFSLNFDSASEKISNFKNNFKKELGDIGDVGIDTASMFQDVWDSTGKEIADNFKKGREGSAAALALENNSLLPEGGTSNTSKEKEGPSGTQGSGSGSGGSGRSLTMNLHVVQNFYETARDDVEEIATQTVRLINDKMRDAVITTGV